MPTIQHPHGANGRPHTAGVRDESSTGNHSEKEREVQNHGAVGGDVNDAKHSTNLKERKLSQDSDRTPIK